ncbi:pyruvate formate lyase family protein [Bacteroidota bacterium]
MITEYDDPNVLTSLLEEFTRAYKDYDDSDSQLREAYCNRILWKGRVRPIQDGDLFAGRTTQPPIGFIAQSDEDALGYYFHPKAFGELLTSPDLTTSSWRSLKELEAFWKIHNTVEKSRRAMSTAMKKAVPSEQFNSETGIAFALWRMSGIQLDYMKLLKLGIPGLEQEVRNSLEQAEAGSKTAKLYEAMMIALNTFRDICNYYANMADQQAETGTDTKRSEELKIMAAVLRRNAIQKPASFREGLQLMWLYNIIDGTRNYGRMDDYLGDLYAADKASGDLDDEEAIRLLSDIWKLMRARDYRYDTRLIIGGKGRTNEKNADQLALLIMETSNRVREIVPQVALRFYKEQNPTLYRKGLDVIGTGYTYPMLYNDDVNLPAVEKAFEVRPEEAVHVIQYGCGEYVLDHRSVGTPSGIINLLQALIVTINKGIDPATGSYMGMSPERYKKYDNFKTFEDLYNAYKEQLEYHVAELARHEELEYIYAGKDNPYLYTSMLMDDCIKRGKGIFAGGIRYLGGTLETYGNANTSDSLVAIRELVYRKKVFSLEELRKMLEADFIGYERERKMILSCPKYGNDNDIADRMYTEIHDHVCSYTREQREHTSLDFYLVVVINNDANTVLGKNTSASPDGRRACTYMNPGNNPVGGADRSGVTAFMNSITKPDTSIHAGAVQNMKFSKDMFTKYRDKLEDLLATYFRIGGAQAMLTVVDRGQMEEAMEYPERHQNLIIRVGGFSERFVNLPPEAQREVLSRTLY